MHERKALTTVLSERHNAATFFNFMWGSVFSATLLYTSTNQHDAADADSWAVERFGCQASLPLCEANGRFIEIRWRPKRQLPPSLLRPPLYIVSVTHQPTSVIRQMSRGRQRGFGGLFPFLSLALL